MACSALMGSPCQSKGGANINKFHIYLLLLYIFIFMPRSNAPRHEGFSLQILPAKRMKYGYPWKSIRKTGPMRPPSCRGSFFQVLSCTCHKRSTLEKIPLAGKSEAPEKPGRSVHFYIRFMDGKSFSAQYRNINTGSYYILAIFRRKISVGLISQFK
jgi:hypothetical protein